MNGLQVYRNYIENIVEDVVGYSFDMGEGLESRVYELDELEEADKFLEETGRGRRYISKRTFMDKEVTDESLLDRYLDLGGLVDVLDYSEMVDIEDAILANCGSLCDTESEVNYTNIGIGDFDMGDDPMEVGEARLQQYEEDIKKFFDMVDDEVKVEKKRKRVEKRWGKDIGVREEKEEDQEERKEVKETREEDVYEKDTEEYKEKKTADSGRESVEEDEEYAFDIDDYVEEDEGDEAEEEEEEYAFDIDDYVEDVGGSGLQGGASLEEYETQRSFDIGGGQGQEYLTGVDEGLAKLIMGVSEKVEGVPRKVKRISQEMQVSESEGEE